ncbi:hypothetical protein [Albibacterium profundi]|uniref:PKD domain-containing protein n=1 Tax=Albibacterium profundi TaxID=3134906 RepID=A0ABV5CF95_9SPHI
MADNIILNIPFDEPSGSEIAYDFSENRADAIVENATFVPGREGNAIRFTGNGTAESPQVFILDDEFTITFWVKPLRTEGNSDPKELTVLFAFAGVDQYIEYSFPVLSGAWTFIAITRSLEEVRIYSDLNPVESLAIPEAFGALQGYSVLQDYYGADYGYADVYDLRAFNAVLGINDLSEIRVNKSDVSYILDNIDLNAWDIFVSSSEGIIDGLRMKQPFGVEWSDEHGETIDLSRPRFDVREIVLSCFMKAEGKQAFLVKSQNFLAQFRKPGTKRLVINAHPTKPLVYEVYMKDGLSIDKTWNNELMVGTFQLRLREPEPVKRVLMHVRNSTATKTVTITFSSNKMLNFYWGDGTKTLDVSGTDKTITHDYADDGEYHIIIAGVIEDITHFTTNAIIVWNNL